MEKLRTLIKLHKVCVLLCRLN